MDSVLLAATPPLTFLSNLHTLLLSMDWGWLNAYETNGNEYLVESPQGLKARVRIWYVDTLASPNCFILQVASAANPLIAGAQHRFIAGKVADFPGDTTVFTHYRVWANCCQLFIGADHPESWLEKWPRAVQCGVPHSYQVTTPTPECAALGTQGGMTSELWFSAGDDTGADFDILGMTGITKVNFRNSYFAQRFALVHNGNFLTGDAGTPLPGVEANNLQLCILRTNFYWNAIYGYFSDGFRRFDGSPLAYTPMLCFQGFIFGTLWDACLLSIPMTLDATEDISETLSDKLSPPGPLTTHWRNYCDSHGIFLSTFTKTDEGRTFSLLLLKEPPDGGAAEFVNIAY
jgi:hypothetical protein